MACHVAPTDSGPWGLFFVLGSTTFLFRDDSLSLFHRRLQSLPCSEALGASLPKVGESERADAEAGRAKEREHRCHLLFFGVCALASRAVEASPRICGGTYLRWRCPDNGAIQKQRSMVS